MSQQVVDFWGSYLSEVEKLEKNGMEQIFGTMDEATLLAKAHLTYVNQLGSAWRRLGLEAMRRSAEAVANVAKS
jgi:hypothetical protein